MSRRQTVDCHFHLWEESFPRRPFPWTPDPFPASALLATFDELGVARGIDVTPIMYGFDNAYGLRAARASAGRIRVFGRFDAFAPRPQERLAAWLTNDFAAGIRLTFYGDDLKLLDDPAALGPFWRACEELQVPVAVFAPDALWEIVRAIERHPRLRLIVDHLGLGVYPGCEDPYRGHAALEHFAPFEQVLVKISGIVEVSRERFPFRDMHDPLASAVERFGAERLMWGSNFPVVLDKCSYTESLEWLEHCEFLDDDERSQIVARTCAKLLDSGLVAP